ncbi:hypothetical protein ATHL_02494 [Anaerolinea thermolimosa]|uniref:hypothetical protein n=1 Tax=Anaerolinea thermolimosa TaxID=229919 RepID=UPI000781CEE9|nr:hypothetical protein [Anaerolinea thermolimosa]GAP07608.1 hypothetical protein ATHL_02494 [Anaerolinea thermolimosa]
MNQALPSYRLSSLTVPVIAAGLAVGAGLLAAPHLPMLELFHLLTSLAYLLLLFSVITLATALGALRARIGTPFSFPLLLLLGYALPALAGWLPVLLLERPIPLAGPGLLWIPATQAAALTLLFPLLPPAPVVPENRPAGSSARALFWGLGLGLAFAFLFQLAGTGLPALTPPGERLSGLHLTLALLAAVGMAFHSARLLRGQWLRRPAGWLPHALLAGALTFRPLTFLPAAVAACLFSWLAGQEGQVCPAMLAHLAFNLSALLLSSSLIH